MIYNSLLIVTRCLFDCDALFVLARYITKNMNNFVQRNTQVTTLFTLALKEVLVKRKKLFWTELAVSGRRGIPKNLAILSFDLLQWETRAWYHTFAERKVFNARSYSVHKPTYPFDLKIGVNY